MRDKILQMKNRSVLSSPTDDVRCINFGVWEHEEGKGHEVRQACYNLQA